MVTIPVIFILLIMTIIRVDFFAKISAKKIFLTEMFPAYYISMLFYPFRKINLFPTISLKIIECKVYQTKARRGYDC